MAVGWRWWRASSPLVARGAAALYVAGVALAHIHLRFAWQAWHLATSTCVWHGSLALVGAWSPLVAQGTAALCVAGVALAHIHHRFARQAWHLATSTCVWRGMRGPCGTGLGLVALGRRWSPLVARGAGALCGQAWHLATSTCVLRGRRGTCGTWRHLPSFGVACVALVALGWVWQRALLLRDIGVPAAWQAYTHLGASTLVSRGRHGTYGTGLSTFTRDFVTHNSFTCNSFTHHCFTENSFTNHSFTHSHTQRFHMYNFGTLNSFTHAHTTPLSFLPPSPSAFYLSISEV